MRKRLAYIVVALALLLPAAGIAGGQVRVFESATRNHTPRIFACYGGNGSIVSFMAGRMPKCPASEKLLSWDAGTAVAPAGLIISGALNTPAPSDQVGNVGDYFLDLNTYQLWGPKVAGATTGSSTWGGTAHPSLKGPKGDQGSTGQNGQNGQAGQNGQPGVSGYNTNAQTITVGVGTANLTVSCNQGSPLGGGEDNSAGGDVVLLKSFPTATGWNVSVHNGSSNGTAHAVTAWVVCAHVSN
jgi:hypothetical protein